RVAILEARMAHVALLHPGPPGDAAHGVRGVHAALGDGQQQVFAAAIGLEGRQFGDPEILPADPVTALQDRRAMRTRQAALANGTPPRVSRHTAMAAMPSPRPVKPSFSLVVALTLTRPASTCRSAARVSLIARAWGPIFGRSQMTVMSALARLQPSRAASSRQWRRKARLSASFHCGSVGGKCWPMSPRASAPSMASHSACIAT